MRRLTFLLTFITSVILTTSTDAAQNPIGQTEITTNRNCTPTPVEAEIIVPKQDGQAVSQRLNNPVVIQSGVSHEVTLQERNGDCCENAIQIPSLPYASFTTTEDNTDTWGNPSPDEWYRLNISEESIVTITVCYGQAADFDTYLWLLTDDCATVIAQNDDT
jgi:hypothetical protein